MAEQILAPLVTGTAKTKPPEGVQLLTTLDEVDQRMDGVMSHLTPDRSAAALVAGSNALLAMGRRRNEILAGIRQEGVPTIVVVDSAGAAAVHLAEVIRPLGP